MKFKFHHRDTEKNNGMGIDERGQRSCIFNLLLCVSVVY